MIKIGNKEIGQKHVPFIIAEMSGNHNQSLERALDIVEAAAKTGAHALKIQTYTPGGHFIILNKVLKQITVRYPKKTNVTILSQQNTKYDTLVNTMDAVRVFNAVEDKEIVQVDLFPDISIGDAPKSK